MGERRTLHFTVEGGFVTQMGREKLFIDKDLGSAMRIIMSATETDQLSYEERLALCLEILNGDAEITGSTADDSYGVEIRDDIDERPATLENIAQLFMDMKEEKERLEKENHDLMLKFSMACSEMSEYKLDELNAEWYAETGEPMFSDRAIPAWRMANIDNGGSSVYDDLLDSYMAQRRREDKEEKTEDYGWLSPEGEWFPVPWGEHSSWAQEWLNENKPFKDFAELYWTVDEEGTRHHIVNGDVLIYSLGWVLLDNPYRGLAKPKKSPKRNYTKDQKEFLYDYFIERGRNEEANRLYED